MSTEPPSNGRHEDDEAFAGNGSEHKTPVESLAVIGKRVDEARLAAERAEGFAKNTYETQLEVLGEVRALGAKVDKLARAVNARLHPLAIWSLVTAGAVMAGSAVVLVGLAVYWLAKGG